MSNFITDYIKKMRASDERTKHRSAIKISLFLSVIILSLFFGFFGRYIFDFSNNKQNSISSDYSSFSEIGSSFSHFWSESHNQINKIRGDISTTYNLAKTVATSTVSSSSKETETSSTSEEIISSDISSTTINSR